MNINDPFGRVQSKRQKEYESLRLSLKKVGLTDLVQAEELLAKLRRRGNLGLAIIVPGTLLLALVLPELRALILACGGLALFWLFKTLQKSQDYIKRYMREELGEQSE